MPDDADSAGLETLMQAVERGEVDRVKQLLAAAPQLANAHDEKRFGAPPLNIAVASGTIDVIDALLDAGAEPDGKSDWWAGPFGALHSTDDPELVSHLIDRGASVDVHAAAKHGMMQELRRLIEANPQLVHARGGDGQLPLHFASSPEIAAYLLQRGAEIDARDLDHVSTAAQWAVIHRPDVCRFLLSRGATGDAFMHCALGDARELEKLVATNRSLLEAHIDGERFPSPGSRGGHIYMHTLGANATLLHVAARFDRVECAQALLGLGMSIDIIGDYDECAPLHVAAWNGHTRVAGLLLDHGADIERESGKIHRTSVLCWAIVAGSVEMVRFLFERGAKYEPYYAREAKGGLESTSRFTDATDEDMTSIVQLVEAAATSV